MNSPSLIAARTLRYRRADGRHDEIVVALYAPVAESHQGKESWACTFTITAFGQHVERAICGDDAMQALVLALHILPTEVRSLAETEAGEFVDEPDLGIDRACRINLGEPDTRAPDDFVARCIHALSGPHAEDAWHRLIEAGPGVLPSIIRAVPAARDTDVRVKLIRAISEDRAPETVVFLSRLLTDQEAEVWKSALDALVSIGGSAALAALHGAKEGLDVERQSWIAEAVIQIERQDRPG